MSLWPSSVVSRRSPRPSRFLPGRQLETHSDVAIVRDLPLHNTARPHLAAVLPVQVQPSLHLFNHRQHAFIRGSHSECSQHPTKTTVVLVGVARQRGCTPTLQRQTTTHGTLKQTIAAGMVVVVVFYCPTTTDDHRRQKMTDDAVWCLGILLLGLNAEALMFKS